MAYSPELREAAKRLYLRRWTPDEIREELQLPNNRIVYFWADKYCWRDLLREEEVDDAIARRVVLLADISDKTPNQIKELDMLIEKHVKLKKLRAQVEQGANDGTFINEGAKSKNRSDNGSRKSSGKKNKKKDKPGKNDLSHLTEDDWLPWIDSLFDYQRLMRDVKNNPNMPRTRNVLKSRQVGFTYGCSGEALEDAWATGEDQNFVSATKAQAEVFKMYIVKIAHQFFDIELKGNPLRIKTPHGYATLSFLATSTSSAQSRPGNVYIDEYFWIRDFKRLRDVAMGCATQSRFHKTFFSTPSAKNHPAYPFWTGDEWKGDNKTRKNIDFPTFKELKDGGRLCPDQQWRYVIDVYDAKKGGCNLIDPEQLREEFSADAFKNLYLCQFVDDTSSVFKFDQLEKLMVPNDVWQDFKPKTPRPFGNREIWLGYDPSRTRDNACVVVIAPPATDKEKFRILERHYWKGLNFQHHVNQIDQLFKKYNVTYLGIDTTGIGGGVWDLLKEQHPREAVAIHYSTENKNRLVMKMIDVVDSDRLQIDDQMKDIPSAFMAIKRVMSSGGGNMTFKADRSDLVGHADAFWACAHAIINEPLNHIKKRTSTWALAS